ncbi:ABC transporter ATP-binding protein/permease [Ruminococcus sp. OA3]|uniref:ABC transporter ATP-binding protein n=1 Tax=Ruminococcus sp. OA3 TaxID=2914164 RepID=UPI001F051DD7|nr:ABC transporter ATP-binding protein [Ruminococcus sp. OA3]MCH1983139.1 ABC transporter ATP-binding protein/permease [Ruminococcus sp. OA3]
MFKSIKRIIQWTGPYKKRLFVGCVCSFFATWCTAGPVMLAAWALGLIIGDSRGETAVSSSLIWICLAGTVVMILLRFLFTYGKNRLQESIGTERAAEQRIQIGDVLKRVSLGYFSENNTGDILAATTTELSALELQSMKMIDSVVGGYIQILAIVLCVSFFCPVAALITVVGVLLSTFALCGISRQSSRTAPVNHKAKEDLSAATIEYVRGLAIVKSFGGKGASAKRFRDASRDSRDICIKNEYGFVPWNCLHLLFLKGASVALVLVCAREVVQGNLSLPMLLMAAMFSFTIFAGVESINDAAHVLSVIGSAMDKLEKIECAAYIDQGGQEIAPDQNNIVFRHVSFGYGEREILHDISFTIPQNATTAIVGPSGSGKSTICSLIARFYDVQAGSITFGGHDLREFTCDSLLRNISMVFQNVYLFHDTICNNIMFGRPGATREEVIAAARAARCHDFIMELTDGYDTIVGEGGCTLSGGEKQRISVARAILKDAPVIILDEATASVDPENEHEIQAAISALVQGKTIIMIAHRLTTIENADQILVVEDGRIGQRGTHQELICEDGLYRNFVNIRERAEGWKIAEK